MYNTRTVRSRLTAKRFSASYGGGSTATQLAIELAQAVDQNATLTSQFASAAIGPIAYVHALNVGTQYDYSWTSSCTYNSRGPNFDGCSFTAGLSPTSALSSPQ